MHAAIRDRTNDARFLWDQRRRESALLLALVAVAARARLQHPKLGDRERFVRTLEDAMSARISVEFRGRQHPIEELLYKWLRCELVHSGGIPQDIVIDDALAPGLSLRAGGAPEYVLKLSPGWFEHLIVVADC